MSQSPFSAAELNEIRKMFPHTSAGFTYLNHASINPLPTPVRETAMKWIDTRHFGPVENFEELGDTIELARKRVSDYIHSPSPGQVTFMGNTSDTISAVANGLEWNKGDEIILNTMEFPANIQPYRRLESQGVKLHYIPHSDHKISVDQIRKYITPKTRLVSISAVQYLSGFRADLRAIGELCKENEILFVVDGIQALGAVPIDVTACHIHALGTGGHKWLMAPMGVGFLFLAEEMQKQMNPVKTGWLSVEDPWALTEFEKTWLPISQHLETGTPNIIGISCLSTALQLFNDVNIELIEKHILHLTSYLINRLQAKNRSEISIITSVNPEERAGIVSFRIPGIVDSERMISVLKENKIMISARENYFRVSPHFYNTEDEIDNVLDHLFSHL
ncbi:aminotransferase class V-fold PLP-dependent enzyme [Rhodohalobacter sp. SW132]|uniref:aminotransferase class V-fold PLP-dependent enzyme n=1 Tax=Rhodohalobacter sp. SW132 TaxID=2293433 RepID=UPI000E27AF9D|nr:aminotransferase class V-fold PLP-dependent enzyme [Rhodohalobacter sp. SW132]REL24072.1 aminotransferase class V-fold PLP-dependent enzyme [Rhodohalobacter sp. SW132]